MSVSTELIIPETHRSVTHHYRVCFADVTICTIKTPTATTVHVPRVLTRILSLTTATVPSRGGATRRADPAGDAPATTGASSPYGDTAALESYPTTQRITPLAAAAINASVVDYPYDEVFVFPLSNYFSEYLFLEISYTISLV